MSGHNILIVTAHPDDEVLGMGGTIARFNKGHSFTHIYLSTGVSSRPGWTKSDQTRRLRAHHRASSILDYQWSSSWHGDFPDNAFDQVPMLGLAQHIGGVIQKVKPEAVFTHSPCDLNVDHARTFRAVMTAARPQPGCPVRFIYSFAVPSSTNWGARRFRPALWVDTSRFWLAKREALLAYRQELRDWPHVRSLRAIKAADEACGAEVGVPMAEAFETVRMVY